MVLLSFVTGKIGTKFKTNIECSSSSGIVATQEPVEDSDEDSNSDDGDGPAGGGVVQICAQLEPADHRVECESTELTEDLESDGTGKAYTININDCYYNSWVMLTWASFYPCYMSVEKLFLFWSFRVCD